ncbi:SMI1/KNR4 family protein [Streptococcus suis]|nr:SMI1/KNR4 family protein [Streptococcus suis]NQM14059.1 SMI1/KNR4 family protein [Streptococcus suis]
MLKIFKFDNENVLSDIEVFERNSNIVLPKEYREFLLKYNGGHTPKTTFKINGISSNIRGFYGLGRADNFYNLKYPYLSEKLDYFIQNFYFPIATDSFGNDLLINYGDYYGNIYFYDHENQTYTLLANSFTDFIKSITSKKFVPRSIDERLEGLRQSGSNIVVDDALISLWQEEINKYQGRKQEVVSI